MISVNDKWIDDLTSMVFQMAEESSGEKLSGTVTIPEDEFKQVIKDMGLSANVDQVLLSLFTQLIKAGIYDDRDESKEIGYALRTPFSSIIRDDGIIGFILSPDPSQITNTTYN